MAEQGTMRKRWLVFAIVATFIDAFGYQAVATRLLMEASMGTAVWLIGFDWMRSGRAWPLADALTPETERWLLFAITVLSAALIAGSGGAGAGTGAIAMMAGRIGSGTLYFAIGLTIMRQGARLGERRYAWWEYGEELRYGALGNVIALGAAAGVTVALGQIPDVVELLLIVTPAGLLAVADEPLYLGLEPYVRRWVVYAGRIEMPATRRLGDSAT